MRTLIVTLMLVGCAESTDDVTDTDTVAPPTTEEQVARFEVFGSYRVGYDETSLTYADPVTQTDRTNRVGVWYPTAARSGDVVSFTGPKAPQDVLDAPDIAEGTFPLAVFSHGHQGDIDNVSGLMAWFASHGWIAIAPEHTGNTLADGDDRDTEIHLQRPRDISNALDVFLDGDTPWTSHLSGDVFGFGHSFGGYTTFLLAGAQWDTAYWDPACDGGSESSFCATWSDDLVTLMDAGASDARIAAFASLSGGNWGELRETGLAQMDDRPFLQVSGALDSSVSNEGSSDPIWRDMPTGNRVRVDLAHGDHQTYTDFSATGGGIIPGTSADAIEAERGYRILRVYLGAFSAAHVLGETDGLQAILDGSYAIDDDVTLSTK